MGPRDDEHNATPQEESWSETLAQDAHAREGMLPAESVEQYVQLHEHIERLRQDKRPDLPAVGMPDEARTYQTAALFHAALPDAAEPDPTFVESLVSRMETERKRNPRSGVFGSERRGVSRRSVLGAGAIAAAAALVGATAGAYIESTAANTTSTPTTLALVPEGAGVWLPVAQVDSIPVGGVLRFNTEFIVGFIRHTEQGYSALSGACTHMGCLLMWNNTDRTFDCPCHGGRFAENGISAPSSPVRYNPLPPIQTRVESGQVWVYVAPPSSGTTEPGTPQPQRSPTRYGAAPSDTEA